MTTMMPGAGPGTAGLLSGVIRMLAARGEDGIADVLQLAAEALDCDELVLRDARAALVVARVVPEPVSAAQRPSGERWVLDAPVRADDRVLGVLTATSAVPLTPERAAAVTAVADAVALALVGSGRRTTAERRRAAGQAVLDAEADRAQLAAGLQERVEHALVALKYSAALVASGQAAGADVEEPARAAFEAFRHARRDLRAHALEAGLRSALAEVAGRAGGDRQDDGHPMLRVELDAADPVLDTVPPPLAVTVQRVAETVLRGATGRVRLVAAIDHSAVKLRVDSADIACDASELDRWDRRVRALGGSLRLRPDGVDLSLPAPTEGSHDDGPDL